MKTATKNPNTLLAVAGLTILLSANALAGNVRIIANPSVRTEAISASEIKSVFLQERNSLGDGTHVEPVLSNGGPVHAAFLKEYLDQNDEALQNYYRTLVFTGKGLMPKILHSDEDVVAYVAKTRGAIGYVSPTVTLNGVKTLAVYQAEKRWSEEADCPRRTRVSGHSAEQPHRRDRPPESNDCPER